jgi:ComF family protein
MKKMTRIFNRLRSDLLQVLYPGFCLICDTEIQDAGGAVCPVCEQDLHYTHFEGYADPTSLDQLFWGRVPIHRTYAMLYFQKQNETQRVLHALKYKDRPDVARYFGAKLGEKISKHEGFSDLEALIPVPLHPKKEFLRGYNQSRLLAEGITEKLNVPVRDDLLKRIVFTESQTKKNKISRWENMQNRFESGKQQVYSYKHVGIVDDVVTTGSTIETCVGLLKELLPEARISVISLAVAR